ncbi:MAG: single-stranded DNA-binding protein [Bacteroidota bacterium]|nr:single-stranded DNA-binding protein [Bacteroidota bacterium]
MAGVNKVILIGNLGADPEVRHLEGGNVVANFNLATSETYNKNGEKVTQTEWHRIEAWEGLARVAEQYLKKGNSVYIEGKIKTESWQDKDGNNRYTTKIRANTLTMLGGKGGGGTEDALIQQAQSVGANAPSAGFSESNDESDNLPF